MAKKKKEEQEETKEELVLEAQATPEPSDPVKERVMQIVAFFPQIKIIEGEPIDPDNPYHQIIAAFEVGRQGLLRR